MRIRFALLSLCCALLLSLAVVATAQDATPEVPAPGGAVTEQAAPGTGGLAAPFVATDAVGATARIVDVSRTEIGTVTFTDTELGTQYVVQLTNLPPGIHGFHLHSIGVCADTEMGSFMAAGQHWDVAGNNHPLHTGDLAALFVLSNGSVNMVGFTDRFTVADMFDADGTAVIAHALPDNYAHIPERYGGPDAESLASGDSGEHIVCGVVEQGEGSGAAIFSPAGELMDMGGMMMTEAAVAPVATPEVTPAG